MNATPVATTPGQGRHNDSDVGVASLADLAGYVTIGVASSFVQPLLQLASSDPGELITACVLFDVYDPELSPGRPGVSLLVSCQFGDWGQLLLTTCARTLTGGLVPCGWLNPVMCRVWLVVPPINVKACTTVTCYGGWVRCIWIVYAYRRSVEVLLLTGTLVFRIFVSCLTGLCFRLLRTCCTVPNLLTVLHCRLDQSAGDPQRQYSWFCAVMMASRDGLSGWVSMPIATTLS